LTFFVKILCYVLIVFLLVVERPWWIRGFCHGFFIFVACAPAV